MLLRIIIVVTLFTFPFAMALGTLQGSGTLSVFNNTNIAKPNCPTHCGDVEVPYPFGIGNDTGCALDNSFYVTCDNKSDENQKLFLGSSSIQIYNISDTEVRIATNATYKCYNQRGTVVNQFEFSSRLSGFAPLTFSQKNRLTVLGCDDYSFITGTYNGVDLSSSACLGVCTKPDDVLLWGSCSGAGCCTTTIPKGLNNYTITLTTFQNHSTVLPFNPCGYAFLGEEGGFVFRGIQDLYATSDVQERIQSTVPVVLDWVIPSTGGCFDNECKENSSCVEADGQGYRCRCNDGYVGNPYLDPGCQDFNECEDLVTNPCYGVCTNTPGGYNCSCPPGSFGNATIENGCQASKRSKSSSTVFIIPTIFGILAIICGIAAVLYGIRRRKLKKIREKFFEKNGGVLLKQKIDSQGSHDAMTLFTTTQLRKATRNYSKEKIIGRGVYGVVYKGVLSDKRVVAIKRSRIVDGSQAEQFINEVLILTKVIHRNVVRLLGCCLEEEVPILVYEFISNNTLSHHLHSRSGGTSWLSWENRLRVAVEAASGLAYLHSETIMPIIHRNVKSTNILIDDNYTAKVSDSGASRLVPLDLEQVTTLIQGTLGYLDPEYFNTSQLTEKSDVYSFGVVLAELITGKKPIGLDISNTGKSLATYFVSSISENRLYEIVEPRILREGTFEQIQAVCDLVKRCLNSQGHERPTMKEVVVELDSLRMPTTHPWIQQQTSTKARSLVLEVEQSNPFISYGTNDDEP